MGDNATSLNFNITTTAELSALRETERETIKALVAAKALGKSDDVKKFGAELGAIQSKLSNFSLGQKLGAEAMELAQKVPVVGTALSALGSAAGPVTIALGLAAASLKGASAAIDAFAAQEADVAKLNQSLANSGQFSEEASDAIQELANRFKELTGIDDSRFINVARTLLQFGAKTGDLEKYTEAVTNLAGLMGGDVEGAAKLFGKALQGNTDVMGRYGIKVDATASQVEKLDSIMQQAAARGAGQLTAGSETLARRFTNVKLGTEDIVKGFGNLIARTGIVQVGLDSLAGVIGAVNSVLPGTVHAAGEFTNKLGDIAENADEAAKKLDAAKDAGESLAAVSLAKFAEDAAKAAANFDQLTTAIRAAEQARVALTDAALAAKLAQIDDDEDTKKITATEAAQARFSAKAGADREKTRIKLEGIDDDTRTEKQKIFRADDDVANRSRQVSDLERDGTRAQSDGAAADYKRTGDRASRFTDRQRQEGEIDELKKKLKRAEELAMLIGDEAHTSAVDPIKKELEAKTAALADDDKAFADEQARLAALVSKAEADVARIKGELEKLKPELEKAKADAAKVRAESTGKIGLLGDQRRSIEATTPLQEQAAATAQKKVERDAAQKDAEARNLAEQGKRAGALGAGAKAVGAEAKATGNKELFDAAKALSDAATDAQTNGTTTEEVRALVEAAKKMTEVMQKNGRESKALKDAVATITAQMKSGATLNN